MTEEAKQYKNMACKFLIWFIENPNDEVYKLQVEFKESDDLIGYLYDNWLVKYFNPETIE